MAARRSGRILLQMAAIIGIGFGIGVVDAFIVRPMDLSKRQAPQIDVGDLLPNPPSGASNTKLRPVESPTQPTPAGTSHTPEPPAVRNPQTATPATGGGSPTPGTPAGATAFVPTKKEDLPKGQITLAEAKQAFDAGAMFVDARKAEDFVAGHVENALRIESDMFRHGDPPELGLIPRSAIVVVYCNGGHCDESENVATFLSNSGYDKVFVMHDGFPGWKSMGYPLATGE